MTKQLTDSKLIIQGVRNLLNLLKSTTKTEEEFTEEFRNLLSNVREEYDYIKNKKNTATQLELASIQNDILIQILSELGIETTATSAKKKTPSKRTTKTKVVEESVEVESDETKENEVSDNEQ